LKSSEVTDAEEIRNNYYENSNEMKEIFAYNIDTEPKKIVDAKIFASLTVSKDMKSIYFIEDYEFKMDLYEGQLVKYSLDGKQTKEGIADDVTSFEIIGNSDVLYFKSNGKENSCNDLYLCSDKKDEKIGEEVANDDMNIDLDTNAISFLENYNIEKSRGRLVKIKGYEKTIIAEDVASYKYKNPNNIYYINEYSYNSKEGQLWKYEGDNNKKLKIDDDVSNILYY